jgi:hypothetical protein
MLRILLAALAILAVVGCSKPADVMATDNGPSPIARTTQCTVPNADGQRCNVKTCKADAKSDCAIFQQGCTTHNHTYTGDNDSGTCTRGPTVGRNDLVRDLVFASAPKYLPREAPGPASRAVSRTRELRP